MAVKAIEKIYRAADLSLMESGFPSVFALDKDGKPVLGIDNIHHMNAYMHFLINKIGYSVVRKMNFKNPFSVIKGEKMTFGRFAEEIHINPAVEQKYDPNANPYVRSDPDLATLYHEITRASVYPYTSEYRRLKQGCHNAEIMGEIMDEMINSLYFGNETDDFEYCKRLYEDAVDPVKKFIKIVEYEGGDNDHQTAKNLMKAIRLYSNLITFPSTEYNSYANAVQGGNARVSITPKENQMVVIPAKMESEMDVEVLAWTIDQDKAKVDAPRIIPIDKFKNQPEIDAILCDVSYMFVKEVEQELHDNFNGASAYTNYFLHVGGIYSLSLFSNAIAFKQKAKA